MTSKTKSWEVSDKFWSFVKPLIPKSKREKTKDYKRKKGGGRKLIDPRKVFSGIVYVLRTGCQWNALPKELFGSPTSVYTYFRKWGDEGFFSNYGKLDLLNMMKWKALLGNGKALMVQT